MDDDSRSTTEFLPFGQGIRSEAPSRGSLGTLGALGTWSEILAFQISDIMRSRDQMSLVAGGTGRWSLVAGRR
jgi:hypothetical protein